MKNGWFYLLIANIAVLSANIWLFKDKPQPEVVPVVEEKVELPIFKKGPLKDFGISSVKSFHFPLMEPLPSKVDLLQVQLTDSKATIDKKNSDVLKEQQRRIKQSEQLALLKAENNELQKQIRILDNELSYKESLVAKQKRKITQLESIEKPLPILETEIARVKNSIENKPDLIKPKQEHSTVKAPLVDQVDGGDFSGSVEFGFLYEQDNQVTKNINGRLILDYDKVDNYNINSDLEFEFENEDGDTSTEKYRWQLQSDYNLDPSNLVYARSDINRSQFSSYEQEDIVTVGYGRVFYNSDKQKFNFEIGPGYRFAIPNEGEDAVSIDEFIIRTKLNYERVLTDSLQIKTDAVLEAGKENSVYSLSFKAQNRIYQELYLVFNFEYKYTQNVPVDTVNEEASSGLSLLYAF